MPRLHLRTPLIPHMGLALKAELEAGGTARLYTESMATALAVHLLRRYSLRKQEIRYYAVPHLICIFCKWGKVVNPSPLHKSSPASLRSKQAN